MIYDSPTQLLLLLSRFSRVRPSATPCAAHQAPPSVVFSRQEHWSGVPLPHSTERALILDFFPLDQLLDGE